jgi:hypothetical protein
MPPGESTPSQDLTHFAVRERQYLHAIDGFAFVRAWARAGGVMSTHVARGLLVAVSLLIACGARTGLLVDEPLQAVHDAGGDSSKPPLKANKVDLLFAIDNSRSMGDKQALLAKAVPAPGIIGGFLTEVADMHIAIVSSSLGGGGAEQTGGGPICPANALEPVFNKYSAHNDDKGHLINRVKPTVANSSGVEDTVLNARPIDGSGGNFLAWLPGKTSSPNVPFEPDHATLDADFQTLVTGVQEEGCGLEAQMESWYRFLVQPDPYDSIQVNPDPEGGPPKASLVGTDAVLLKQRHDFLRPDSVVIVIQVTDEEDSWSDPLALGGRGWATRATGFPGSPTGLMPRETSYCDQPLVVGSETSTGPSDPNCTSCAFAGNMANGLPISSDPNCQTNCGAGCAGFYTAKDDNLNIRYVNDMKRRYGLDPQFPVARYVDGLTSAHVPNRDGEHPGGAGTYKGTKNCINPLFARTLPTDPNDNTLCDPTSQTSGLGPRDASLVYYVHVGGVPWQLLADPTGTQKPSLTSDDWRKIIGKDPASYDLTGIDPHMIESYLPRVSANQARIPYLSVSLSPITSGDTADPYNGREWDTTLSPLHLDLQYACTFDLPAPKECSNDATFACDCGPPSNNPGGPPLCADGADGKSLQIRGKAYPTIRELRVAQALGDHAVVGSLCTPRDPFAPVFTILGGRLASVLTK